MTTEVAIINRQAIALATDSAVTVSLVVGNESSEGKKIFNTANKLFSLSRFEPIGVMVYGSSSLTGVPWEALIKVYRAHLGDGHFPTVDEYAKDFIKFLSDNPSYFLPEDQEASLINCVYLVADAVKTSIESAQQEEEQGQDVLSEELVVDKVLDEFLEALEGKEFTDGFDSSSRNLLDEQDFENIRDVINEIFGDVELTDSAKEKILKICELALFKDVFSPIHSGIVIAGFGRAEMLPDLRPYKVEYVIKGKLKYAFDKSKEYANRPESSIIPFAQEDVIFTFVAGLSNDLLKVQIESIDKLLSDWFENFAKSLISISEQNASDDSVEIPDGMKEEFRVKSNEVKDSLIERYIEEIDQYKIDKFIQPVMQTVSNLPKEELAEMAESLVSLTSLRRKVSTDEETVGGPTDVAIISKGDGFIWYKRKHYFEPSLNQDFFNRRNKMRYNEDTSS
jgi:hypothetical protein